MRASASCCLHARQNDGAHRAGFRAGRHRGILRYPSYPSMYLRCVNEPRNELELTLS